ncbi:U32 family peptidase [Candidatus Woesearchaeota archaeon]|nr:U32 family peptidase [Candidatus Woesearchaeota archaeon]
MIKITAPVNQEMDARLDADEFYTGHLPGSWIRRFGILAAPSRRYFNESYAQDAISKIVRLAGAKPVYITYNAPFYNEAQKKIIIKDIEEMIRQGVSGFIIADFTLIDEIHKINKGNKSVEIHLSTVGNVFNKESARFFFNMGVDRIILPRQLKFDEIKKIVTTIPGKYEVFMLFDLCRNIDGMCSFQHGLEDTLGYDHGCLYLNKYEDPDKDLNSRISYCQRRKLKFPMFCAACYIDKFKKIGIHSVKIVGRRMPHELKEKGVQFIRAVINGKEPKESYARHFLRRCPMIKSNYY